jgi:leader peptidase (prepilin peptidase) / N-methyltransferase
MGKYRWRPFNDNGWRKFLPNFYKRNRKHDQKGVKMSLFFCVLIGAVIALVLNYLADVLPVTRKFSRPCCNHCGHTFSAREYLISFKCPECKKRPSLRYWLVMFLGLVGVPLLAVFPLQPLGFWISLPLVAFLALVAIIDIEHKAVLIETDIAGIILGVIYGLLIHDPLEVLLGGIAGAGLMLILYFGGVLFNRVLGKIRNQEIDEVALGLGDVFVCGYLGLIMGWPHIVGMIIIAILIGGVFALGFIAVKLIRKTYSAFMAIPYVPFLILAALIMFYLP